MLAVQTKYFFLSPHGIETGLFLENCLLFEVEAILKRSLITRKTSPIWSEGRKTKNDFLI